MPKIRCKGCENVLNLPDKALGKVVACPKCGTKMKVPAGPAGAATAKPSAKKAAAEADDPFGSLDLSRMEAADEKICPYCAAELKPEDPVCRSCGMNVSTGMMDAREQKKRAIRGPDPGKFFSDVWGDGWRFVMNEKKLALRTGTYWMIFSAIHAVCAYMGLVYCDRLPPKTFWVCLTVLSFLGIPGWYLFLTIKVISSTMSRETFRSDRIFFDFFLAVSAGMRLVFWPLIVMGPVTPVVILLLYWLSDRLPRNALIGIGLTTWVLIPLVLLPIALVHMTDRYTYKAWILWELLKLFVKNAVPTLYFLFVSLVVMLPLLAVAIPLFYYLGTMNPPLSEPLNQLTDKLALWIMEIADLGREPKGAYYTLLKAPLNIAATFLVLAPVSLLAGFPALFLMRANGLFGYYNHRTLDIVGQMKPGTVATFWVRYLAHTIDSLFCPLAGFLVTANPKALSLQWGLTALVIPVFLFHKALLPVYIILWCFATSWMYWVVQESSQLKSTLGKDAFGLMVETDKGKTLSMRQASIKWFWRMLFYIPFGIPFLTAIFNVDKKALHDIATRTRVVWKGDK
ncbi:RDD family protein [Planctomicrobium sp. SH664]|uniref:RDD family protein n=1 Tax=Planctomicrobium sp. SH664 TaxID=3448125 RepID=UPI003F5BF057